MRLRVRSIVTFAGIVTLALGSMLTVSASAEILSGPIMAQKYNKCVDGDVSSGGGNGSKVQMWDCNNLDNQLWMTGGSISGGPTKISHNGRLRCLDGDVSSGGGNGSRVQLWDCNGLPNQNWQNGNAGEIVIYHNGKKRCLDVDVSGGVKNGSKLQLWDCNGLQNQKWNWA